MKKIIAFLMGLTSFIGYAQKTVNISFETSNVVLERKENDFIKSFKIISTKKIDSTQKNYEIDVSVNTNKTNIALSAFEIFFDKINLENIKSEENFFINIKGDSLNDRDRKIVLDIVIKRNDSIFDINTGENKELEILLKPYKENLKGYEYLAYVGTNFDLVEGVKAKDLFFAANIYSAPNEFYKKNVGFYLSLYGNRAMTQIDSAGVKRESIIYSKINDTSYYKISAKNYYLRKRVTDNIGAYISPLFQIKKFRSSPNRKSDIKLFYSPSLEFVYRRTTVSTEDLEIEVNDSIQLIGDFSEVASLNSVPEPSFAKTFNEYSFNAGVIALFMSLENEHISVRVHSSVGYSSNYYRNFEENGDLSEMKQRSDIFFAGRAWITEATTGITLQAEVTNLFFHPRPFFVATLSKAFNFREIGKFFQPIVSN